LSPRANQVVLDDLLTKWNKLSKRPYEAISFRSFDQGRKEVYHTDCVLTLLSKHALLCTSSIDREDERERIKNSLSSAELNEHPYKIIELTHEEISGMCANVINLLDGEGNDVLLMSGRARLTYKKEAL